MTDREKEILKHSIETAISKIKTNFAFVLVVAEVENLKDDFFICGNVNNKESNIELLEFAVEAVKEEYNPKRKTK